MTSFDYSKVTLSDAAQMFELECQNPNIKSDARNSACLWAFRLRLMEKAGIDLSAYNVAEMVKLNNDFMDGIFQWQGKMILSGGEQNADG